MAEGEVAERDDNRVPVQIVLDPDGKTKQRRGTVFGGGLSRADANEHYRAYHISLGANTDWAHARHIDVGTDLQARYGASERVRAQAGFIVSDSDIQVRFNGLTQDEIRIDISTWGKVFELSVGDLGILDIYLANYLPSGAAPAAAVFVFVSG